MLRAHRVRLVLVFIVVFVAMFVFAKRSNPGSEQKVLPDLAPLAPYELRLATIAGRTVIRFTGSFWNKGYQTFEFLTENQVTESADGHGTEDVYQNVQADDSTYRKKFVGTFVWHAAHDHHHYGDFADYVFEPARPMPEATAAGLTTRQKVSFCLRDDERMPADIPDVPLTPVFTTCGTQRQGLSAGWIDVYSYQLPDQYVDVHDMPPGVYALSFSVDPTKRFLEERVDNNSATTLVQLDVQRKTLRVIGTFSPFLTDRNRVDDGTLIRNADNGNIYVIRQNRKRWLRSADILAAYGYSLSSVYPVTDAMAEAIVSQALIRRQGASEVYVLNDYGYRRQVPSLAAFSSYGWMPSDIADINDLDFASYPESQLIMRGGDVDVYVVSGSTKRPIGTLSALQAVGHDLKGLHLVNQTDFDSYSLR